ncbi:hypothetical protein HC762_01210 [bacterium]|nr:hypothetical protein [bacterium]
MAFGMKGIDSGMWKSRESRENGEIVVDAVLKLDDSSILIGRASDPITNPN